MFSAHGSRPVTDMMAGGDLDGDNYFVCWDSDLIPKNQVQPADYTLALQNPGNIRQENTDLFS